LKTIGATQLVESGKLFVERQFGTGDCGDKT
jgi:hypothetical protein